MAPLTVELKAQRPEHLALVHAWVNDPEIQALSSESLSETTRAEAERRLARWVANADPSQRHFAIHLAGGRAIGFGHLALIDAAHGSCKVGLVIGDKACWGRGLGTAALRQLVHVAFETLKLRRIGAEAYATNPRSLRMLERVGFVREGCAREAVIKDGRPVDELCYGLLAREWQPSEG